MEEARKTHQWAEARSGGSGSVGDGTGMKSSHLLVADITGQSYLQQHSLYRTWGYGTA